ncbi:MAG: hypothetical protein U9R16_05090 [Campylobacterota bacterium]|nr:hypothetical protein [Campylobacterota bacterium]
MIKNNSINIKFLFSISFIIIISVYLMFLGTFKTVNIITDEYLFILAIFPILLISYYFKKKLSGFEIIDYNKNNTPSIQSAIGFFLVFQVVDFYYEDGFIGMISQWFIYWIMGVITVLLMTLINYYRNYKRVSSLIN